MQDRIKAGLSNEDIDVMLAYLATVSTPQSP